MQPLSSESYPKSKKAQHAEFGVSEEPYEDDEEYFSGLAIIIDHVIFMK